MSIYDGLAADSTDRAFFTTLFNLLILLIDLSHQVLSLQNLAGLFPPRLANG